MLIISNPICKTLSKCLLFVLVLSGITHKALAQPAGWQHKLAIRITNPYQATTKFHQLLLIDTRTLVDAGQLSASMKDLRFGKDANGNTLFPYFIESGGNTASTRVWVQIDSVPANNSLVFYMFYGNNNATLASTLSTFLGPFNTTDSTTEKQIGSAANNSQRGIWFRPKQSILLTGLGKQLPVATTNTVTLFDLDTENILEQTSVGGPAEQYNYTTISNYRWLNKGADYVVEVFVPTGSYYQANLIKTNKYLSIPRMVFCNGCDASTLPDPTSNSSSFAGFNGGYADIQFYVRNDSIDMPSYEFGPFMSISTDTLKNAVYAKAYTDTVFAIDGVAPYTYGVLSGSLPGGFSLSTAGVLSGTASEIGIFNFEVKVTDASGKGTSAIKNFTLVLDKASQTISFNNLIDRLYGDTSVILRAAASSGLPVTFTVAGGPIEIKEDTVLAINGTGGALITARQAGNQYYNPVVFSQGFMINARPLAVTADNKTKTYGDDNPGLTVTYDGLVNGDVTVPGIIVTTDVAKASGVGEYEIEVTADASTNYQITYKRGKFTVTKRELALSLNANPLITKVYDGKDAAILQAANYNLSNMVAGDDVTVSSTTRYSDNSAANNKTISATNLVLKGTAKDNYKLLTTLASTTGNITAQPVTVSLLPAPAVSKIYDGNDNAAIAADNYLVTGILQGDEVILNKPVSGLYNSRHAGEKKTVTVSGLQLQGIHADNYTLAYTTTSADIGAIQAKGINLMADNASKVYGAADPAFTYQVTGLLGNDALTGTLAREQGENAGEYAITKGSMANDDYKIENYTQASLAITQAEMIITADDIKREQGQKNPELTFTYKGFVRGEDASVLTQPVKIATPATQTSPFGDYDIIPSGAAADNYHFTYINGKLTVLSASHRVRVWLANRNSIQLRISSNVVQKATIQIFSGTGQPVLARQQTLTDGINDIVLQVGKLSAAFYVVKIDAEEFRETHKINIR
ncbi:MAG: DUF2341 domain-containing protein [Candidatus Pseudobacter hemicellulosilyticus]|uniref:DUF2341 domain-containing protein n=1 Tax=Candidatus Pseudobacter hemicellulosilyticus TaxID=3121375 RepID=A0AAJ6BEJ2_9BACT|nr:MAG: DUF2341 domain-containing protein [Pseudobacter sp.]